MQYYILLNSFIYYEMNENLISDKEFDSFCKKYLEHTKKMKKEALEQTQFYEVFKDFDGTTGFYLCSRLKKEQFWRLRRRAEIQVWYSKHPKSGPIDFREALIKTDKRVRREEGVK